jgi:hypothetical protein
MRRLALDTTGFHDVRIELLDSRSYCDAQSNRTQVASPYEGSSMSSTPPQAVASVESSAADVHTGRYSCSPARFCTLRPPAEAPDWHPNYLPDSAEAGDV